MQNSDSNWQDLRPQLRMEYLLKSGHLSDCSFVVYDDDGEKIVLKCHKFVLMSASPVFERMFDGHFEEANSPDNIVLDDVSGSDFQKFISYLYWHDNQRLDSYDLKSLQSLIYLSKKFMIPMMTTKCLNVIKKRLTNGMNADDTIDLFEYAHQLEDTDLITTIKSKMIANAEAYINTAAVFDLSSDMFLKFIDEFFGCCTEKIRFYVIDRYCKIHGLVPSSKPSSPDKTLIDDFDADCSECLEELKTEEAQKLADKKDENENEVEKNSKITSDSIEKDHSEEKKNSEREQKKREEYIGKLLESIKFTSMTAYDFCSGPGKSNLLTVEKKYELLSAICISNHKIALY